MNEARDTFAPWKKLWRTELTSRLLGFSGVRPIALLELALFIIMVLAVDLLWGTGQRFISVTPHPFWLIILLLTGQYGIQEGLLAALACTLALYLGNLPEHVLDQDDFEYWYQVSLTPLLWLLATVIFGEIRLRQHRRHEKMRLELTSALQDRDQIAAAFQRVKQQKERLEGQIAGQMRTVVSTYRAAKAIERLDPSSVVSGAAEMVRLVMNPSRYSLFLLQEGGLASSLTVGWDEGHGLDDHFPPSSPIYEAVVGKRGFLCVVRKEDREILDGEGVLAGPLVNPETGEVTGMLKIENLGFLDLNLSNLENFKALCEWVGASYQNAKRFQTARSNSFINPDHQLLSYGFLPKQLEFLSNLGRRVGFDVFMIVLRLENADDLPDGARAAIPRMVSRVAGKILRTTDLSFDYETPGYEFAFLLPNTPEKNVYIVRDKLRAALDPALAHHSNQARFTYTVQTVFRVESPHVQQAG